VRDDSYLSVVRNRIREARLAQGLRQEDVAEAAGLQLRTYQRFEALMAERGSFNPTLVSIRAIARSLNVDLETLGAEPSAQEIEAVNKAVGRSRGRPRKAIDK
jgi:transcriptional regulator with XRE-family HTH domain